MYVRLYQVEKDSRHRIKSNERLNELEFDCRLYQRTDLINPSIDLLGVDYSKVVDYNYAYIPSLKRYYFISNISVDVGKKLILDLKVDVLNSFWDDIKNSEQLIVRQQYKANDMLVDSEIPLFSNKQIISRNFGTPLAGNVFVLGVTGVSSGGENT